VLWVEIKLVENREWERKQNLQKDKISKVNHRASTADEAFKTNHETKSIVKTFDICSQPPANLSWSMEGTVNDISESSGVRALGSQDL
jgi:hypothetical protein